MFRRSVGSKLATISYPLVGKPWASGSWLRDTITLANRPTSFQRPDQVVNLVLREILVQHTVHQQAGGEVAGTDYLRGGIPSRRETARARWPPSSLRGGAG